MRKKAQKREGGGADRLGDVKAYEHISIYGCGRISKEFIHDKLVMLESLWRDQNHYLELCAILDLSTAGSKEEYLNAYCNEQTSILHKILVRFPVL